MAAVMGTLVLFGVFSSVRGGCIIIFRRSFEAIVRLNILERGNLLGAFCSGCVALRLIRLISAF